MSDHLLRLARIVAGIAYDQWHPNDSRSVAMDQLVRDLEAAPKTERTITRKQYEMAVGRISSSPDELSASVCALICLREWDLTVEG